MKALIWLLTNFSIIYISIRFYIKSKDTLEHIIKDDPIIVNGISWIMVLLSIMFIIVYISIHDNFMI